MDKTSQAEEGTEESIGSETRSEAIGGELDWASLAYICTIFGGESCCWNNRRFGTVTAWHCSGCESGLEMVGLCCVVREVGAR